MEALRAELVRAKERARLSDAAAEEASVELKAEQTARCQGEEKVSMMALALENATGRCEFLEKENKALMAELDMARQEAREARSEWGWGRMLGERVVRHTLSRPSWERAPQGLRVLGSPGGGCHEAPRGPQGVAPTRRSTTSSRRRPSHFGSCTKGAPQGEARGALHQLRATAPCATS